MVTNASLVGKHGKHLRRSGADVGGRFQVIYDLLKVGFSVFETALEQERENSRCINQLYELRSSELSQRVTATRRSFRHFNMHQRVDLIESYLSICYVIHTSVLDRSLCRLEVQENRVFERKCPPLVQPRPSSIAAHFYDWTLWILFCCAKVFQMIIEKESEEFQGY